MYVRALIISLFFVVVARATDPPQITDAKVASDVTKACEYDAKVKQFDCLDEPPPRTDCFLRVIDAYDICCRQKGVRCPALKF